MKRLFVMSMLFVLAVLAAGCDGERTPAGPIPPPRLEFTILAPPEIDTKKVVEVIVRIDVAQSVDFPLRVEVEKANVGEDFFGAGTLAVQSEAQKTVTFPIPIAMDPTLRVTVTESGAGGISVTQTVAIDVLDYHHRHEDPDLKS
ncbi:MAG TPA: hypothetical protein VM737_03795 [Gemmatimonadota bacterium]|nr:hypothetical protein [Gemmatimonadota bacterium]